MTYQLPTDADGVKYHGREYDDKGGIIAAGVDEHGNDKPILINTDGSLNMQSVVQELHDIKQRQQEILERLDDPIDTRVTGSNVELIAEVNDAFVPAETKVKVIDKVDTSDFLYIFVQVRPRGLRDYTVYYRPFVGNENAEITEFTFLDITGDRSNKISDNRRPFGLNVSLYVENKTQEDNETFEVYLLGVRR